MTDNNCDRPNFKSLHYNINPALLNTPIEQHFAAAGDLNNDQIKRCRICIKNGWPHEAITFEQNKGRIKFDGTNEINGWTIRDYFTGLIHEHKQQPRIEGASG